LRDLLKEVLSSGVLDTYAGDETQLPAILGGIDLVRKGAYSAAMRLVETTSSWGGDELGLMRRFAPREKLLNAAAEEHHGALGKPFSGNLAFFLGAVLGDAAEQVRDFYATADEFITRVVGLRHDGRLERLAGLSRADVVSLIWQKANPYDANAVLVLTAQGDELGYLRRGIARQIAQRLKQKASISGHVAALLGEHFDPNERLYVGVKILQDAPKSIDP